MIRSFHFAMTRNDIYFPKTMKATFLVASYPFILMEGVVMLQQYFCTMNCFKTLGGLFFYQMQYILGLTYLFSDILSNIRISKLILLEIFFSIKSFCSSTEVTTMYMIMFI